MGYPAKVFPPLGHSHRLGGKKVSLSASLAGGRVRRLLDKDIGAQYINCEFEQDQSL